ncbi:hypothetical protein [Burkholderia anthina]|uniref:hypothetical protein n=1 Tax=Burkholderia anthina TaxID=179879 RepID=UPI00158DAD3F|nr:hypothetical protein [Burkholderia anthina]
MAYFFNGRLYITPTTASAVDDSALANQNLSVGNVACYIGLSTGGQPGVPLTFGSPQEALNTLIGGELAQACAKAFSPSTETGGASSVVAIRVNPAVQATLNLKDSLNNAVIAVTSADWGLYTNQVKLSLSAGTTQGYRATVALGSASYAQDNIYSSPFSVVYTGAQTTATMTITPTSITLAAPAGTTVATIDLNAYPTVQKVVDYINTVAGFAASVSGGSGTAPTLNGLDNVVAQSVKTTTYNVTANLSAIVSWLNGPGQPLVTATRVAGAGTLPVQIPFTYLSGGADGTATNTNWSSAFTALQAVDVQWITPITSNSAIWAMADAHAQFMSTVGRMERRVICGMALGSTDAQAITAAFAINSDRTSLVHIGHYDYDQTGQLSGLQLFSPYLTAAIIAGAFSGVSPGTPMTNKALSVSGLERLLLNPTNTDPLITGGVLCVEKTKNGFMVVQSISTWLVNDNYDKVEQSVGWALDYVARNVRDGLDVLRGQKNNQITLARAASITESRLRQLAIPDPQGPGVLAGDPDNPAYQNITAAAVGDAIAVSFQCSPVLPANYIAVTIYAVPFTGTASA